MVPALKLPAPMLASGITTVSFCFACGDQVIKDQVCFSWVPSRFHPHHHRVKCTAQDIYHLRQNHT